MPSNTPLNAVDRQWELLTLVPGGSLGKTAAQLSADLASAGFQVTRRTVERDLDGLQSRFPITHDDDQPFRWHWASGNLSVMGMSMRDAFSLQLLQLYLEPVMPAAMRRQLKPLSELARKKLQQHSSSNSLAKWSSKVAVVPSGVPVLPPAINEGVLNTVQEAVLGEEQIRATYVRSDGSEAKGRILHPLGLVVSGAITYLVAVAADRAEPRAYPLHRMKRAVRTYEPVCVPAGFTLQTFIDEGGVQFGALKPIQLEAWVSPVLAAQLADTRLTKDQVLVPNKDGAVLRVTINYTWRLKWWILSKTGDIVVVNPPDVRKDIALTLRTGVTAYDEQILDKADKKLDPITRS